jgi:hypothetical protein
MRTLKTIKGRISHALFAVVLIALAAGSTGCAMTEPLATEHLQQEAKDPRVSIVLLRFKAPRLPPAKNFFGVFDRYNPPWIFAVANESTGWNFRRLDPFSMIFRSNDASMEPDFASAESGWATFLVPPGISYIAVTTFAVAGGEGQNLIATPFPDHISVGRSTDRAAAGMWAMDFIETPRFAVQVSQPQSLIYAGTIVRNYKCGTEEELRGCPYDLTVEDESEIAKKFVSRYLRGFTVASPMQTQLLAIPQSRTIEIRSGSAVSGQSGQ